MSKILFLDFDGVIRLALDRHWNGKWISKFCPVRIAMLAHACRRTGVKVVLTTDWRYDEAEDPRANLGPLVELLHDDWRTKIKGPRWLEIECWLDENPGTEKFAILDDVASLFDDAPERIKSNLMLCTSRYGLVSTQINHLINHFR